MNYVGHYSPTDFWIRKIIIELHLKLLESKTMSFKEVFLHRPSVIYLPSQSWNRMCPLPEYPQLPAGEFIKPVMRRVLSLEHCSLPPPHSLKIYKIPQNNTTSCPFFKILHQLAFTEQTESFTQYFPWKPYWQTSLLGPHIPSFDYVIPGIWGWRIQIITKTWIYGKCTHVHFSPLKERKWA